MQDAFDAAQAYTGGRVDLPFSLPELEKKKNQNSSETPSSTSRLAA